MLENKNVILIIKECAFSSPKTINMVPDARYIAGNEAMACHERVAC